MSDGPSRLELRLVSGRGQHVHALTAEPKGKQWRLGAAHDAGWHVRDVGLRDYHVELFWDGKVLWVADPFGGTGELYLDGKKLTGWAELSFGTSLRFAGCELSLHEHRISENAPSLETKIVDLAATASVAARADGAASSARLDPRTTALAGARSSSKVIAAAFAPVIAQGPLPPPAEPKKLLSQPLRTWLLLALTVAIFVVFVIDPPFRKSSPPPLAASKPAADSMNPPGRSPGAADDAHRYSPITVAEMPASGTISALAMDAPTHLLAGHLAEAHEGYKLLGRGKSSASPFVVIERVLRERLKVQCAQTPGEECHGSP